MNFRISSLLAMAVLVYAVNAYSQSPTGTSDDTSNQPGPKPVFSYPDAEQSLDFLSGAVENSQLTLGVAGAMAYNSSAYDTRGVNDYSRILYSIRPSIKIRQYLPKIAWSAGYSGGLQDFSYLQSGTHNSGYHAIYSQRASGDVLWQMAKHWQLHGNELYTHSADPFDSYAIIPGTPTSNDPNLFTYYALSQYTQNTALLGITDRLSTYDSIDFTGTEFLRQTSNENLTTVPFYNLNSYGGRASYNHRVSPRLTVGGGYNFNSLDFGHGFQRSGTSTIQASAQYIFKNRMTASVWVGPEYVSVKSVIPVFGSTEVIHTSEWTYAVGATFGWRGVHNSARANFIRSVSDGGGILATTQTYRLNGDYQRQLSRKWTGTVSGLYWNNTSITVPGRFFWNLAGSVAVSRPITRSLEASAIYTYVTQTKHNIAVGAPSFHTNTVGARIQYYWHHPLGR